MKNKLKKTMTALCAALILMGGFSVPAYAQGAATEPPAGDATNDSTVKSYINLFMERWRKSNAQGIHM